MPKSIAALSRRIDKLSGGGAPPSPLGPGWWDDFEGFALLRDPSWVPHCDFDRFVVGRAALLACLWSGRIVGGFDNWRRHRDPDWWGSKVWRSKTANWKEQIEREQRLHCPPENRKSMAGFVGWLYADGPKHESDRPWEWCCRGTGSPYHWPSWEFHERGLLPLVHALAIASACWLVDDLGMSPQKVQDAASDHYCAYKWRDISCLRQVELPPRPITSSSPKLRLRELTIAARAQGIPVDERRAATGDGLALLELLLCVPSGCGGPHGHEMIYPSLAVLEP